MAIRTENGAPRADRLDTVRVTKPTKRASVPLPPLPPFAPATPNKKKAATAQIMPGTAERLSCRGGAGRPARADTVEMRVIARAGRVDAKYEAATARTTATITTAQGN